MKPPFTLRPIALHLDNVRRDLRHTFFTLAHHLGDLLDPARGATRVAVAVVSDGTEKAAPVILQGRDRTADWISSNPFTAVTVAASAGALMATLARPDASRDTSA